MKAVAYYQSLPSSDAESLLDIELPAPTPGPRDLLVAVQAISVHPVDTKIRSNVAPTHGHYAGALQRAGGNSELHVVDERIVGHKPKNLGFAEAAALPLTAITAWELLFERLKIAQGSASNGQSLLIIGAAGGVGSILTQLARQLTGLTVIGTASRPETAAWVKQLGAHHVIDHSQPLLAQLQQLGIQQVDHVASLTHTDLHYDQLIEALAPQGQLALIDDPAQLDVVKLKRKSLSLHWEFMYTRS
ncbi:MAG: NADPH:quinone reductase, partial [Pseudomonas sp. PGPPP3]